MPLIDDILEIVTHPAIMPFMQRAAAGSPRDDFDRRLADSERRLDDLQRSSRSRRGRGRGQSDAAGVDLVTLRDRVTVISGTLDEAARFGLGNPEGDQRVEDARQAVLDLERFALLPEQRGTAADRRVTSAIAKPVRQLRQKLMNRLWSNADLEEASQSAGQIVTALQTTIMAQAAGRTSSSPASSPASDATLSNMSDDGGYGREGLSKGCIPCAMGHMGMTAGSLGRAVNANHTEAAKRVAGVMKELDMLLAYDWVPAKIAQNTPEEQRVIREFIPRVQELRSQVAAVRGQADVKAAADAAADMWASFKESVNALPAPAAYARPHRHTATVVAIRDRDTRIDRAPRGKDNYFSFIVPSRADLHAEAESTNYGTLMDRVVGATKEYLDVRWLTQPLSGEDAVYIPISNTIIRTAEATNPENYHLQTTVHEAAHALLDNQVCFPAGLSTPGARQVGETEADLTTIAVMNGLGLPLEYGDGTREAAGDYTIDWTAIGKNFGPEMEQRVKWASQWLLTAAQEGVPSGTCPAPAAIAAAPVVAPGVSRPVGSGLQIGRSFSRGGGASKPADMTIAQQLDVFKSQVENAGRPNSAFVERWVKRFTDSGVEGGDEVMEAVETYRDNEVGFVGG